MTTTTEETPAMKVADEFCTATMDAVQVHPNAMPSPARSCLLWDGHDGRTHRDEIGPWVSGAAYRPCRACNGSGRVLGDLSVHCRTCAGQGSRAVAA